MVPLIIAGLLAGGLLKKYNYDQASSNQDAAQAQLDELYKQPYAKFGATPQLNNYYNMARAGVDNPQGYTGAERTAYQSDVAGNIATMAHNATSTSGGNNSRFIISALNPAVVAASNQFAASDAELKRTNKNAAYGRLGSAVQEIQEINNMETQAELQRRAQLEQYYGQSVLQNKAFKTNTLDSLGSDLIGGATTFGLGAAGYLRPKVAA